MSQLSWTLLDDYNQRYEIGLYHGDKSHHVLIYVNKIPVVIDFNIRETKQYSFYVGQELCELRIERYSDVYKYSFVTNKEVNTPLNLARRQQSRKYFWFIILLGLSLILIILGVSKWMFFSTPIEY